MDYTKQHLKIINQVFEIEKKLADKPDSESMRRNVDRIKNYFWELGLQIHNPQGERYNETRTDCEASIAGVSTQNLYVQEVIKPIVTQQQGAQAIIVQKGVVVVQSPDK